MYIFIGYASFSYVKSKTRLSNQIWETLLLFLDEGDDVQEVQHQRNERACKGRRYQEFKDQALGRKGARNSRHRSGDRSSLDGKFKMGPN